MAVVIAVDAGTTGVRAIAFDRSGLPVASAYREFPQHFPRPGWVEHDADQIWDATVDVLGEVGAAVRDRGTTIAALGLTDQRETVVVWDRRTGRPLHRAIVWQDRRTAARCDELRDSGHLPTVRATTGLVLDPYFSATKLEWLFTEGGLRPGPDVAVGTVDSWLVWKLTGGVVHATDASNASRTMLFDIRRGAWSADLCELFGVPSHVLPSVVPSSGRVAVTGADSPLGAGVPISGIAGDQQASLFGQACFEPGTAKNTYGTGSFVLVNAGTTCPEPVDGLLTTVAWALSDPEGGEPELTYALEGAVFVTGAAVQWLRDGLGVIERSSEVDELAASVPDTDGVVLVPAFTGLGSPWWDPYARGTLLGLTRGSTRAHLARAALEAMAFQTRDVVDGMAAAGRPVTALRADGGAATDLVLQLQADQLGIPVARPVVADTTALGAAYLAGLAEGVWGSFEDIRDNWALDTELRPGPAAGGADAAHARWLAAVERSRNWAEPG